MFFLSPSFDSFSFIYLCADFIIIPSFPPLNLSKMVIIECVWFFSSHYNEVVCDTCVVLRCVVLYK